MLRRCAGRRRSRGIAAEDIRTAEMADVFHAATAGGARGLLRDDLGRLAPGAKADVVLVDLASPWMMPARDPLRSLVFHAADRAVRDVYVGGQQVVADGRVLTLDRAGALARLAEAQKRMEAAVPTRRARAPLDRDHAAQPAVPAVTDARRDLLERIDGDRDRVVRFLSEFTRIDTSNPPATRGRARRSSSGSSATPACRSSASPRRRTSRTSWRRPPSRRPARTSC